MQKTSACVFKGGSRFEGWKPLERLGFRHFIPPTFVSHKRIKDGIQKRKWLF